MGSGNAGERAIEAGHHPPHMGRPPDLSVEVDIKLYRNKTVHRAAIETFWKAILP